MLLTLRGTPTLYYGDELGLPHVAIPQDRIRDPFELRVPGKGVGRDGARTPMQWSTEPHAGFSGHDPWLPLDRDWRRRNVESLGQDPTSLLSFYRQLLDFRKTSRVLQTGRYREVIADRNVLVHVREIGDEALMVALNFSNAAAELAPAPRRGRVVFGTHADSRGRAVDDRIALQAGEGVIVAVHSS